MPVVKAANSVTVSGRSTGSCRAWGRPAEPTEVAPLLFVQQVDTQLRFEQSWAEIQGYLLSVLDVAGVDPVAAEELTVIPGAEEVLALLELRLHVLSEEWDVVVVPDVQEGVWPDLRRRGTLLGVERMVDVLAGVPDDPALSTRIPLLDEERRLFAVALSRARTAVHVGALEAEEVTPSRFLDDVAPTRADPDAPRPRTRPRRSLVLAELVGEPGRLAQRGVGRPQRRRQLLQVVTQSRALAGQGPEDHVGRADQLAQLADAAGALIEVYTDLLIIEDDANYVPYDWTDEPLALNLWGQMPSPDVFAAGVPVIA